MLPGLLLRVEELGGLIRARICITTSRFPFRSDVARSSLWGLAKAPSTARPRCGPVLRVSPPKSKSLRNLCSPLFQNVAPRLESITNVIPTAELEPYLAAGPKRPCHKLERLVTITQNRHNQTIQLYQRSAVMSAVMSE